MRYSLLIIRVIKDGGVVLVTRLAGMLLSAIAVQLVAESVLGFVAEGLTARPSGLWMPRTGRRG